MKQVNMLRYVTLRYVTLRYVSHSFKLSRLFYCKNLLKIFTNYIHAFSYALKNQCASLNNNEADAHCAPTTERCNKNSAQGVTTTCYSDFASNFEIMSCNKNYDFNHNNFYRNGNNQSTTEVIHNKFKYWIASLVKDGLLAPLAMTGYFLAMIMAENLFLVLGIILIMAFYLIEKLKKILKQGEKHNEKDFSNGYSYIDYGNDTSFRYVWS